MNQRTPYEILIAEKTAALEIPDMADSIWASIDAQLNVDMPVPQQDPSPTSTLKKILHSKLTRYIIGIVVVGTIIVISYTKKKPVVREKQQPPTISPPGVLRHTIGRSPVDTTATMFKKMIERVPPLGIPPDTMGQYLNKPQVSLPDSTSIIPPVESPKPIVIEPSLLPVKKDSTAILPGKKPKGVKGIKDEDYRIKSDNKKGQ